MAEKFIQVARSYLPVFHRMAQKIGKLPCWITPDDIVAEMLLNLWECWKRGELESKTRSYILQNCWFSVKNYLRKSEDKVHLISLSEPIDEEGTSLEELIESDLNFFRVIEVRQLLDELQKKLTPRENQVLHLQKGEYTTREIARELNISHVRVVKIQHNIKKKARTIL